MSELDPIGIREEFISHCNYQSPWERIDLANPINRRKISELQFRFGNLSNGLGLLRQELSKPSANERSAIIIALVPPLLIRAVLKYKNEQLDTIMVMQGDHEKMEMANDAIELALSIYSNNQDSLVKLDKFYNRYGNILGSIPLGPEDDDHKWDETSIGATLPEKSKVSAKNIIKVANGRDIFMIGLANGAIAAALDTFLYFCDFTGNTSSKLYMLKFSTQKDKEKMPRISLAELEYMKKEAQAQNRLNVIFEEDTISGTTRQQAGLWFLNRVLCREEPILLASNVAKGSISRFQNFP